MRMRYFGLLTCALVVGLLASGSVAVTAAAPKKTKQLVYGMNLYQGKGFSGTFSPRVEKRVSLVANRGNVVSPKETLVYYWPITGEYMADWETMNQSVGGKLQILKDDKVIKTLDKVDIGFYYPNGPYDDVATLLLGEKSQADFKRYGKATDAYYASQSKYYTDKQVYEETIMQILDDQQRGKKIDPKSLPKSPKEPVPPMWYVTQPFQAFVVNLPVGEYEMRLVRGKAVIADSTKQLRVVAPRRKALGYDVAPEKKYPTTLRADQPSNVIYYTGNPVMFFNPFGSEELTQYDFLKITKLHMPSSNNGAKDAWSWVYGDPVSDGQIQVLRDGKVVSTAKEQPFYIQQSGTDTARRDIVVWDEKTMGGGTGDQKQQPHFRAYRVVVTKSPRQYVRLLDSKGHIVPGSKRELRAVSITPPRVLLYASFVPLVLGFALLILRRTRTATRR